MSEILESFDWTVRKHNQNEKYPFATWADGRIWKITRKVDFSIYTPFMVNRLHLYASKNGMTVSTRTNNEDEIVFRFTKKA